MKEHYYSVINLLAVTGLIFTHIALEAQVIKPRRNAFSKGCLLVSISEGTTRANYSTQNTGNSGSTNSDKQFSEESSKIQTAKMDGIRDPLFVEYGLTDRLGLGMSSGNDIFKVSTSGYGFRVSDNDKDNIVTAKTSEFTLDVNYHVFTHYRTDISVYTSVGSFGVAFSAKNGDADYKYTAKGGIIRTGIKARYYFYKRLGVLGMVSYYSASASPKDFKGNTTGNNVTTSLKGYALEFGLCFRFF